jgi:hypothetical protein
MYCMLTQTVRSTTRDVKCSNLVLALKDVLDAQGLNIYTPLYTVGLSYNVMKGTEHVLSIKSVVLTEKYTTVNRMELVPQNA